MTETNKEINIIQKIANIQRDVKVIKRDELNSFQKYHFFSEAQVIQLLKPLLDREKLTILITDDPETPATYEKQSTRWFIQFRKKMEVCDNENNKQKTFYFWAYGVNDDPAKAKGAADTYAVKYILSKFFLIPIQDMNDPDYTPAYDNPNRPITKGERKQVNDFLTKHNLDKTWKSFNSPKTNLTEKEFHDEHLKFSADIWIKNCPVCLKLDALEKEAKSKNENKEPLE